MAFLATREVKRVCPAAQWQVSQAEVIRRAVAASDVPPGKIDPLAMLRELHAAGEGLSASAANAHLTQTRADRKKWRAS